MSETDFNSVPINQRPQLETLVSSQAVTALQNQLTAAQSRVVELERQNKHLKNNVSSRERKLGNLRRALRDYMAGERTAMLELKAEYERAKSACEVEQVKESWRKWSESQVSRLTADNARLRELLRECHEYVPVDLRDFIKAALR